MEQVVWMAAMATAVPVLVDTVEEIVKWVRYYSTILVFYFHMHNVMKSMLGASIQLYK